MKSGSQPKKKLCIKQMYQILICFLFCFLNSHQSFMRFFLQIPYGSVVGVFFRLVMAIQKKKIMFTFRKTHQKLFVSWRPEKITLICFVLCVSVVWMCLLLGISIFVWIFLSYRKARLFRWYIAPFLDYRFLFFSGVLSWSWADFFGNINAFFHWFQKWH
jgi:hypothetical protein